MNGTEKNGTGKGKILLAIDGSEASELAVKRAGQAVKITNNAFEIIVLTVIEDAVHFDQIPEVALYQEKLKRSQEIVKKAEQELTKHEVKCKTRIAIGPIAAEVVRVAEEEGANFIFIGSRGIGGIRRKLLGSTAEDIMRYAHCSVVVVRG